jgi:hypothetical protein
MARRLGWSHRFNANGSGRNILFHHGSSAKSHASIESIAGTQIGGVSAGNGLQSGFLPRALPLIPQANQNCLGRTGIIRPHFCSRKHNRVILNRTHFAFSNCCAVRRRTDVCRAYLYVRALGAKASSKASKAKASKTGQGSPSAPNRAELSFPFKTLPLSSSTTTLLPHTRKLHLHRLQ